MNTTEIRHPNFEKIYSFDHQKISIVKDTVSEFEGYLQTAKSKIDSLLEDMNLCDNDESEAMKLEDNDESMDSDVEDDFTDDAIYEVCDFSAVEDCVALMTISLNTLKTGLGVMTLVADQSSKKIDTASDIPPATPGCISSSLTTACDELPCDNPVIVQIDGYTCNKWVSEISRQSDQIESAVTDFGAELYPPLTSITSSNLQNTGRILINLTRSYISLLQTKAYINEEAGIATQVLQESFSKFVIDSGNFSNE